MFTPKLFLPVFVALAIPAAVAQPKVVKSPATGGFVRIEVEPAKESRQGEVDIGTDRKLRKEVKRLRKVQKRLVKRTRDLERAVVELQQAVRDLQDANGPSGPRFSCLLKTPFDGSYLGKGTSKLEARAQAEARCRKVAGNFKCNNQKMECETSRL